MMIMIIFGCDSYQTSVLAHLWRLAQGISVAPQRFNYKIIMACGMGAISK